MIKIISNKQLADSMRLAQETGSEASLIRWLIWLDEWYSKDKAIIEVTSDMPMSPGSILWHAYHADENGEKKSDHAFYNGGLIYHKHANEWSVHS